MTTIDYILPMPTRNILFILFPGFELLDLSGPAAVFSTANHLCPTSYEIHSVSTTGGMVSSSSMLQINSSSLIETKVTSRDTLLVVGGEESPLTAAANDTTLLSWLKENSPSTERYGSICSGAFLLATAGLLHHRRATTHWAGCRDFSRRFPDIRLQEESLYVVDGKVWTSAGVTTGIDMALEMIRQDLGNAIMNKVAQRLVVYAHRQGTQSQFSPLLEWQARADNRFTDLLAWIDRRLDQPLRVSDLAAFMHTSERSFYRNFTQQFGITPAKYIEQVKFDRAKQLLESKMPVNQVAEATGFKSEASFRTRFQTRFGLTPSVFKALHGTAPDAT